MQDETHARGHYGRFMAMVGTSTALMFGLMYLNTYALDHVMWSETRFWMTFVMGAVMAVVMLLFMWGMYRNKAKNWIILGVAALVFALALWLVRSQTTVTDTEYMQAMIPHHSIAINNARKADIRDPRVRYLADRITRDQVKEIAEMRMLLADIRQHGRRADRPLPAGTAAMTADGAREAKALVSGELLQRAPL